MIVAIHALTGAALGRLCRSRPEAFLVGALSHLVGDMLPHRDLGLAEEALLAGGALALIGAAKGSASREFVGACGAIAPDLENVVGRVLDLPDERLLLPTHSKYHGRKAASLRGQLALALCCLAVLSAPAGERCEDGR